jgi:hypothetical protein
MVSEGMYLMNIILQLMGPPISHPLWPKAKTHGRFHGTSKLMWWTQCFTWGWCCSHPSLSHWGCFNVWFFFLYPSCFVFQLLPGIISILVAIFLVCSGCQKYYKSIIFVFTYHLSGFIQSRTCGHHSSNGVTFIPVNMCVSHLQLPQLPGDRIPLNCSSYHHVVQCCVSLYPPNCSWSKAFYISVVSTRRKKHIGGIPTTNIICVCFYHI